ncbi:MAG TPA: hypothetical protein VHO70_09125 [Chitinispirillaceae bacterium]|nr:hypothetical protein [Chitinispirillaceae bacterium]
MKKHIIITGLALIATFATMSFARVGIDTKNEDVDLGIGADAWMENGQYAFYFNKGAEKEHQWINRTFLNLCIDAVIKEHVKIELGIEGRMWLNIPKGGGTGQAMYNHKLNSNFIIDRANGNYFLGDVNSPLFEAGFGRFAFKYNQDVRNLGEYLFRSGTYPAYLINNFDLTFARVTGFKLSSNLFSKWHHDLLLTFETDIPPFYDASLTYLTDVLIGGFFNIGAGLQFAHLISVDNNQTTPEVIQGTSNPTTRNMFVTTNGDTGHYSFRGTKLMGRISFNPIELVNKIFSVDLDFFGPEDFKIYSEAAILGLKNYPKNDSVPTGVSTYTAGKNIWGYDILGNKIPIVFGINIPTFKILDVLAFEAEWYGCTYSNNYFTQLGVGPGQSYPIPDYSNRFDYTKDNWKWSLYAKKKFSDDRLGVVAQLARDHIRAETLIDEAADLEQALRSPKHLWWMVKFLASF